MTDTTALEHRYLQLSVIVLAQVSAMPGDVPARPVTIKHHVWFGKQLTSSNKIGISLACLGSLLYSLHHESRKAAA